MNLKRDPVLGDAGASECSAQKFAAAWEADPFVSGLLFSSVSRLC